MKTIKQLLITIVALLCSATASAYDFEVDGIYYNILSEEEKTVEVTSGENNYTGTVTIPESIIYNNTNYNVTSIEEGAFYDCYSLISIEIPGSITSIGKSAFYYCEGLTSIEIPDNVTNIGDETFAFCKSLTSIEIPSSITSIGKSAFYYCEGLTNIDIPDNVTNIGDETFAYCQALSSIKIPGSVTNIGDKAFTFCRGLTSIEIPNSVTSIGDNVFYACSSLTSVTIPSSVTSIGNYAFAYCKGLTSIEIPNSVTSIGDWAFASCNLRSVTIPNSVTNIGHYAFAYCSYLTSVTIPNSVTRIRQYAFRDCNNLKEVHINDIAAWCNIDFEPGGNPLSIAGNLYLNGNKVTDIIIPNSVTSIGVYAFDGCSSLTSITIPNSVTNIRDRAFSNCTNLRSLTIPNSVTTIGHQAFSSCERIVSITIPNSVTSIGRETFSRCNNLTRVSIGSGLTSIEEGAFSRCEKIVSITIPNNITNIGYEAFAYCKGLTSIEIPNSVTNIGDGAFSYCSSLTSVTIPKSVSNIGICAFWGCSNLTSITSLIPVDNLFVPGIDAFYGVDKANSTLYVPYGAKETYAAIEGWNEFTNIVEIRNTYTASFTIDGEIIATKNILEGDTIVYPNVHEKEGYSFVWEGPTTMPAKDIVIEGKYTINSYTVTFIIDGEVYKSINVEYGAEIELPEVPEKEGYTFGGWSEIPETMPAKDIVVEGSFSVNSYLLTYKIDGETYATDSITYGATITPIAEPTKEGHTFSGWSEIPETMPAKDIIIEGSFSVNSYLLTYKIDGETYATDSITYGATITPIAEPTKKGHTFSGWSEIPETMPAKDIIVEGSFSVNSYLLTYKIDGETYATDSITYGATITPIAEPTKEGHTFSGWSEIPETMPAKDIIVEGSFSVNSYLLTYKIDGETYATDSITYGATITPIAEPTKEGHTFSGWSKIPETMPAKDIIVEGSFSVNSYLLAYKIDGETYATDSITYGATITPIAEPTKEGHTFSGWSEVPETMPAKDIIVEGSFSVNSYTVTFMIDGDVYETATVEFGAEIELPTPAEKPGYIFSGWLDVPTTMPAKDIVIEGKFEIDTTGINTVTLDLEKNEVYNLKGQRITESKNLTRGIYIVNGKKTLVK